MAFCIQITSKSRLNLRPAFLDCPPSFVVAQEPIHGFGCTGYRPEDGQPRFTALLLKCHGPIGVPV
jgi:hypothetical protein